VRCSGGVRALLADVIDPPPMWVVIGVDRTRVWFGTKRRFW
jgi:hypothetical protein